MKYLFCFLILMLGAVFHTDAQTRIYASNDTITDAAVKNLAFKAAGACAYVAVQVVNTKVSGTVAGKTYLEGSVNGTVYTKLDSITLVNPIIATDTLPNQKIFIADGCKYLWYRLSTVTSGTQSLLNKGWQSIRK